MDLSRREFLRGLGAGVALAAVPAGFVRLASGLVVPDEEALEREAHRKIWAVGTTLESASRVVLPGMWKGSQPLPQMIAQVGMITLALYGVMRATPAEG